MRNTLHWVEGAAISGSYIDNVDDIIIDPNIINNNIDINIDTIDIINNDPDNSAIIVIKNDNNPVITKSSDPDITTNNDNNIIIIDNYIDNVDINNENSSDTTLNTTMCGDPLLRSGTCTHLAGGCTHPEVVTHTPLQ